MDYSYDQYGNEYGALQGSLAKKKHLYRNSSYLEFVRSKPCLIGKGKSISAHHVRMLDPNGCGVSTKPSDYRAVPLCNEFHTHGSMALHRIGEKRFWDRFNLDPEKVIINLLKEYLLEKYQISLITRELEDIEELIEEVRTDSGVDEKREQRREEAKKKASDHRKKQYQKQKKKHKESAQFSQMKEQRRKKQRELYQKKKNFQKRKNQAGTLQP